MGSNSNIHSTGVQCVVKMEVLRVELLSVLPLFKNTILLVLLIDKDTPITNNLFNLTISFICLESRYVWRNRIPFDEKKVHFHRCSN
jgi:hypothetical protein